MTRNVTSRKNLTSSQVLAVRALSQGLFNDQAASSANVSVRQLQRWLKEPVFRAAVAESRLAHFGAAASALSHVAAEAVATLASIMRNPKSGTVAQVRASSAILSHCLKTTELLSVTQRIDGLEETLNEVREMQTEDRQPRSQGRTFASGWGDDDTTDDQEDSADEAQ